MPRGSVLFGLMVSSAEEDTASKPMKLKNTMDAAGTMPYGWVDGNVLPYAMTGLLVVYSLKNVNPFAGSHGIPEAIAIAAIVVLHVWKRNMLLSIAGGTVVYMALLQLVFA